MSEPMTDEQIRNWKATGEGFHTDEIADELLKTRAEVERLKEAFRSMRTERNDMEVQLAGHEEAMRQWIKILEGSPENVLYVIGGMRARLEEGP